MNKKKENIKKTIEELKKTVDKTIEKFTGTKELFGDEDKKEVSSHEMFSYLMYTDIKLATNQLKILEGTQNMAKNLTNVAESLQFHAGIMKDFLLIIDLYHKKLNLLGILLMIHSVLIGILAGVLALRLVI